MVNVDDRAAILAEVDRFGERQLAPLTQFPDRAPDRAQLCAALSQAAEMGILPHGDEPGFALWELADDADGFQLHLEVLTTLARHSASLALEMHLTALAQRILRAAGVAYAGAVSVVLDGHGGLARYSLARYFAGAALDAEDTAILQQYFNVNARTAPFYFSTLSAELLLLPVWQTSGQLEWHLHPKENLICETVRVHGLDETTHYRASLKTSAIPLATCPANAVDACRYENVLAIHSAGLLAIQAGIAGAAYARAKEYAATRSQGGCLIREHAAVQQLLMNSRAGAQIGRALVTSLPVPQDIAALSDIMEKRAGMQEQLYSSVTDALQVFGGYGYMQDYGLEKLLRDQNHLAQLAGSPSQTRLFLAALENLNSVAEVV